MAEFQKPQSRTEAILQNILGAENELSAPQSRVEELLMAILEQGGGGSGGNLPSGGTAGQFLVKQSATNYDAAWVTVPSAQGVSF